MQFYYIQILRCTLKDRIRSAEILYIFFFHLACHQTSAFQIVFDKQDLSTMEKFNTNFPKYAPAIFRDTVPCDNSLQQSLKTVLSFSYFFSDIYCAEKKSTNLISIFLLVGFIWPHRNSSDRAPRLLPSFHSVVFAISLLRELMLQTHSSYRWPEA